MREREPSIYNRLSAYMSGLPRVRETACIGAITRFRRVSLIRSVSIRQLVSKTSDDAGIRCGGFLRV